MKLKKIKHITPQRSIKMIKMTHQSHQQKKIFTHLTKKRNQRKMWSRNPTHLLSPQKIILTQSTKQGNRKNPRKQLIPPKKTKMTQFTKNIKQGLFK